MYKPSFEISGYLAAKIKKEKNSCIPLEGNHTLLLSGSKRFSIFVMLGRIISAPQS